MHTLAVDVGNTRTKCGLCRRAQPLPECERVVEIENTDAADLLAEISKVLHQTSGQNAVIAGSNSRLRDELVTAWAELDGVPQPLVLRNWRQLQIRVDVQTPETTGIDRLLNARGAMRQWPGQAVIIVDSGTATTVDVVADNQFRGGAILPGVRLSTRALHEHTDALPLVETESLSVADMPPIARSTNEAIQAGVLLGQVGAIRELSTRIRQQHTEAGMVLTGGATSQLTAAFPDAEVDLWLGLKSLASLAGQGQ